jgi:hypothetical protein
MTIHSRTIGEQMTRIRTLNRQIGGKYGAGRSQFSDVLANVDPALLGAYVAWKSKWKGR